MQATEELGSTLTTVGQSRAQKRKNSLFKLLCSRIGENMRPWSWVFHKGSSVGSATTVVNRVIKLQSVGVVVKHHAPTKDQNTNRLP